METDDSAQNNNAETGDTYGAFVDWPSNREASRPKDPRGSQAAWHVCPGFIDPLANQIEALFRKSELTDDDLEELSGLGSLLGGIGYSSDVAAWDLAKAWLDVHKSVGFRKSVERSIRGLASKSLALQHQLEDLAAESNFTLWDNSLSRFRFAVLEPFIRHLRSTSRILKERYPSIALPPGAEAGRPDQIKKTGKEPRRPRRRRRREDPKAGERRKWRERRASRDKKLSEAWAGGWGPYKSLEDLACRFSTEKEQMTREDARRALDRHRKRKERSGKSPSDKRAH